MSRLTHAEVYTQFTDAVAEGLIDPLTALRDALNWMNSEELIEFIETNGYDHVVDVKNSEDS